MTILKKLVVANGKYTAKDGAEKTRWVNIGALHEHDGKQYVALDAHINLAGFERREGDTRVFANLFSPEPYQPRPTAAPAEIDDEIPF